MLVTTFNNEKGGVGKTTTTVHLARAAQQRNYKVLVIDLDPQGNLTSAISSSDLPADTAGIADVLTPHNPLALEEVIVPTVWEGVDLAPTVGQALAVVRDSLHTVQLGAEARLKEALETVDDGRYDLVLIDCPPASDKLTLNAMVAADQVVIVTHAEFYSLNGVNKIMDNVNLVRKYGNSRLSIAGFLVNQFEKNTTDGQFYRRDLVDASESLGVQVFEPFVPKRIKIGSSAKQGEALDQHKDPSLREVAATYDRYLRMIMKGA